MATNCEANLFGTRFSSINPCFSLSPPPLYRADHATSRPHSYVVHWVGLYIYIKKTNFSLETHVVLLKILLKRLHDSTGSRIYTAKKILRWFQMILIWVLPFLYSPSIIHNLICSYITDVTQRGRALTSQQIPCVALCFFANGSFLYDAEQWRIRRSAEPSEKCALHWNAFYVFL